MRYSSDWRQVAVGVLVALAVPATAAAQQQVEDTRAASPDVRIEIDEIIVGSIVITGWDQNEFSLTGSIGADVDEFYVEGGPDYIEVGADFDDWDEDDDREDGRRRWRGRDHNDVDINLEIRVPRGASVEIDGVTASISVSGVDGSIELESVTGNIEYEGNAGVLDLANVTGSITARAPNVAEGDFESVNGNITFVGSFQPNAELDFENVNGNIDLTLPADVSASFDIETMMGDIANDFGPEARSSSRWVPSKELSFRAGSGSAEISIETLQGSIYLRRQ